MYELKSRVRYSEVNSEHIITLSALTDYLQDCCTFHSEDVGVGTGYLMEQKGAWILSSWEIVIKELPKNAEEITIGTWPCEFKGFFGHRNFRILDKEGKKMVFANSIWVYISQETKKPARIPEALSAAYSDWIQPQMDFEWSDRKIKVEGEGIEKTPVEVPPYFIDTNYHMNNGKYIMLAEGYLPKGFRVERIRAEYKKAAVLGDMLYPIIYMQDDRMTVVLADVAKKPYAVIQFIAVTV